MEKIRIHYAQCVQANLDQVAKEKEALRNWQMVMQHETQRITEVIELCGKQPAPERSSHAMAAAAGAGSSEKSVSTPRDATSTTKPRSLVDLRCSHFHPSAGDEQVRPGLVVQAADLNDGMSIGGVVNELTAANVHPCMRDVLLGRAEK